MTEPATVVQLQAGMQLYKYRLCHRIGGGSFGEVWLAEDRAVDHEYAIKILKPGTPVHHRLREAQIGHVLDHNNVVRVHQADVTRIGQHDYVIIAMDYMPNGPITMLANPSHYLRLPDVIRLGKDILRGLEYLHGHDFFHNDVKPENVLIGLHEQGMLTDYGIVGVTQDGAPVQPPTFYKIHAAPEVLNANEITAQTDVFQAGLTLFRMLVGLDTLRQKFNELGEQAYYRALSDADLISVSDFPAYIPPRLKRIILKAINPNLAERFQSALEMRRELEKLNFPGFWTVEETGEFVGYNAAYSYRYEQTKKVGNRYDILALKRSLSTGRETRFAKFCHTNVTSGVAKREIAKFVKAVVEGV
ncbi:serine/threonine-protein kinase [Hahella aquimaris]|uniref:serine/threonine-protein kinase n=1 Tax=Hahella sp. HNIBRBA332 TaxID=3015983 RepID=UPI00273CD7E3|nr:serine/threonine-protein kinase [Hahella sp. HNIBRBA332]WLQ16152.1 serine/threonine-protein kinase [Hahella sp. HNIBRBA332]